MANKDTEKRRDRGLGAPRGNDPESFGESPSTPPDASPGSGRASRDPAEGGDLGLPGGDTPTRTADDERPRTPRRP